MQRRATQFDPFDRRNIKSGSMDPCTEILRSIALFIIISKMLAYTAMMLLILLTDDTIHSVLMSDKNTISNLSRIFDAFKLIFWVILMQSSIICAFGMFGFARLNRYCLSFYGMALILMCIWLIYFSIIICIRNDQDMPIINLYESVETSAKARRAIDIIQKKDQCCGNKEYDFAQDDILPISCCPNLTKGSKCQREQAFKVLCPINQTTVFTNLQDSEMLTPVASISFTAFLLTFFEAALVFYMIHRLDTTRTTHIMHI
ncbi:uncharacterized protein LOC123014122 isoform X1 [Tribolium madens]|uniref:uncharacterized protein LOC123014122 isoform X1 n=1 Tax=Tribolium madens TaxID=41895 RepID=UPI001CF74DB2|nr:uncharacterized protein LOC123014122 isoform X1 [Tribolium madens]